MIGTWSNPTVYLVDGRQVFVSNNYPHLDYKIIKINSNSYEILKKSKIENKKTNNKKSVTFNDNINIIDTYSKNEYDRSPIDSIIYLRTLQRINFKEWKNIFTELNKYKLEEMIVHKDSVQNVKIHNIV